MAQALVGGGIRTRGYCLRRRGTPEGTWSYQGPAAGKLVPLRPRSGGRSVHCQKPLSPSSAGQGSYRERGIDVRLPLPPACSGAR